MRLTQIIEALLFASDAPLSAGDLARVDERLDEDTVEAVIEELRNDYDLSERSFQIYEVAGGYQILTRPEFVAVLDRYETVPQTSRLSGSALEVLAVMAYRQPIGRAEVEEIRGVGSSGVIKTLLDRELIHVVGRSEGLGRPLLYGTTDRFLEHFGFKSVEDLPRPDELPVVLRERRLEPAPELDATPEAGEAVEAEVATAGQGVEPSANPMADEEVAALLEEAEEEIAEELADEIVEEVEAEHSVADPVLDDEGEPVHVGVEVPGPPRAEVEDAQDGFAAADGVTESTDDVLHAEDPAERNGSGH
jgi:segregation and condensation protein B